MPFRYVAIITRVQTKRNHPPMMSSRANVVSRGIFPSSKLYLVVISYPTWWIPPLALLGRNDNRHNVPPSCHSERTVVSRGIFPSSKLYLVVISYPTWWIPPLALLGRNDNRVTFLRIRLQFLECFTLPRSLISQGYALPASPEGKLLYIALGCRSLSIPDPSFQVRNGT